RTFLVGLAALGRAVQLPQSRLVQDFDLSCRDTAHEPAIFQLREGTRGGFWSSTDIVGQIEAVDRKRQARRLRIKQLRNVHEIEDEGGEALAGILLAHS